MVAGLRAAIRPDTDDLRLNELVGELSVRSERFRQLWARHDARPKRPGPTRLEHPQIGPLELHYQRFPIPGTDGQELVTYHADAGTRSAESLALLASLTAKSRPAQHDETLPDPLLVWGTTTAGDLRQRNPEDTQGNVTG
jgi:hypothetical protein